MFEIIDYSHIYHSIMQFGKNKSVSIHQWYPFVEGYSKEFIESILNEINYIPHNVLEPFSGSGTTSLELQFKNINCTSYEVSPFMHLLSSVKLYRNYEIDIIKKIIEDFKSNLLNSPNLIRQYEKIPFGRTVVKTDKLKKWNFNDDVLDGILDIKYAINKIEEQPYNDLFKIVLASILLEVSNVFRNGKCLSYKKNWESKQSFEREEIHEIFLKRVENVILNDLVDLEILNTEVHVNNYQLLHFSDIRKGIMNVPDGSIDLIITSPPYLNSRDYTDIYMLELKVLDLISNYDELRDLRKNTLRSHVQIKHGDLHEVDVPTLKSYLNKISLKEIQFWNKDLLNMIKGYFLDMDFLFTEFRRVMEVDKYIYFNVANSAYFGEEIIVDQIICEIAVKRGFQVIEIRKARDLKSSSQQSGIIKNLRESVIVFKS
jgi:DNA modification methylase